MRALFLVVFFLQFKPVVLETGSFWQVTDFHFDKTYLHPTDKNKICNSQTPRSSTPDKAGKWGNYLCDSPWILVNSSVFAMKNIEPNPDFIVWTGDDLPHVSNDELSTQEVIDTIRNITELLSSTFPNTTVFPALGNHDYHPKHLMPPKPNDIYTAVGDLWSRWLPNDAVATFKKGGFYTTLVRPGLRLVSLNTVYYYTNDKLTGSLPDPAGQFAWLDNVLTNSSRDSEKVFIIGHVPPGAFERAPGKQWFYPQFNKYYIDMVLKHSGVITGHFLAHQHCDSFKIFYDSQGVPRSSIFLCPAVTPWKTVLPTVGDNNPSIRMYKYDRNTTQVKDVWQYFTNLTQANLMDKPDWVIEYKATDAFGIQDVSPQSLHSLVESFKAPNSGNFRKYYLYNSVSAGGEECDDVCKTGQICGITKIDFDEYDVCLNNGTQPTFTFPASNTTSTPSVASDTGRVKSSAVSTVLLVVFVMYCSF